MKSLGRTLRVLSSATCRRLAHFAVKSCNPESFDCSDRGYSGGSCLSLVHRDNGRKAGVP